MKSQLLVLTALSIERFLLFARVVPIRRSKDFAQRLEMVGILQRPAHDNYPPIESPFFVELLEIRPRSLDCISVKDAKTKRTRVSFVTKLVSRTRAAFGQSTRAWKQQRMVYHSPTVARLPLWNYPIIGYTIRSKDYFISRVFQLFIKVLHLSLTFFRKT